MTYVSAVRHAYPEKGGFIINRPGGHPDYTFLHFFNSMNIVIDGKKTYTYPHGVIIFSPNTPQLFYSDTDIVHDWFHFDALPKDFEKITGLKTDVIYYPKTYGFISELTKDMEVESLSGLTSGDIIISHKLEELFIKLGRTIRNEDNNYVGVTTSGKLRNLREKMFVNTGVHWTVDMMAQEINFSPSRLHAVYKAAYGISPTADLIKARLSDGANSLLYTEKTVTEIASDLGYENTSHFIRQFRSHYGVSPGQYRKKFIADNLTRQS